MAAPEREIQRERLNGVDVNGDVVDSATAREPRLGRSTRRLRHAAWPALDLAAGALAFLLAAGARYGLAPSLTPDFVIGPAHARLYTAAFLLYLPLLLVALGLAGAYRRPLGATGPGQYGAVVQGVTFALLALLMATYLLDRSSELSRGWLLGAWVLACALICAVRLLSRLVAGRLAATGMVGRRVVVVGTHAEALTMEWLLRRQPRLGLRVMGFVDEELPVGSPVQAGKSVVGAPAQLREIVHDQRIDIVLISARASTHAQMLAVVEATLGTRADVVVSPDVFTVLSTGATVAPLPGLPVVTLSKLRLSPGERLVKGLFDRAVALALLVILSPLLLALALMTWRRNGGVLERHTALGVGGVPFAALKFRTTRAGTAALVDEAAAQDVARRLRTGLPVRDEPGVTSWGRLLRGASLDELPQLWNVLRGQMSLVGPYKIAPENRHHYGDRWLSVVTLKPGITGMAQVHGRGELTIEERSILDAEYVRDYSLWHDVVLLLATIPAAMRGRGAF